MTEPRPRLDIETFLQTLDDFLWVAESHDDTLLAAKIEDLRSYIENGYCLPNKKAE